MIYLYLNLFYIIYTNKANYLTGFRFCTMILFYSVRFSTSKKSVDETFWVQQICNQWNLIKVIKVNEEWMRIKERELMKINKKNLLYLKNIKDNERN